MSEPQNKIELGLVVPEGDEYVNGRRAALQCLDRVVSRVENIQRLAQEFQKAFDTDPFKFFMYVIVPLLPKEIRSLDGEANDRRKAISGIILEEIPDGTIIEGTESNGERKENA
jgi:hypothetical protein